MKKPLLLIVGPYKTRSGYGQHSRLLLNAIYNSPEIIDEYDIKLMSTKWGSTPLIKLSHEDGFEKWLIDNEIIQTQEQPDVSIQITIPSEFQRIGKFSIGITAGTEVTIAPLKFIEGCNLVDLVITPSQFTKDVLLGTKYDKRNQQGQIEHTLQINKSIEVLFEGYDPNIFDKNKVTHTSELSKFIKNIKEEFCFLSVGTWLQGDLGQDRKDIGMTIKVFYDTFKNKKNRPGLLLKVNGAGFSHPEKDQIINKINDIQELVRAEGFNGEFPNVYLLNGELTDAEMNLLYNHPKIKAMVSFTKGEGYGLPLLEFTSTGKPIICSGYSGLMDFLNPEFSFLLPGELTQIHRSAVNDFLPKEGHWFTVNYSLASQVLNDCFQNYEKYLEKSRKHIQYSKNNFSLTKMQERFLEIWKNNIKFVPKQLSLNLPKLRKV